MWLRNLEKSFRAPTVIICGYEAVALTLPRNRYTPPISSLVHKHKWLFPFFCGVLGAHFWYWEEKEKS